MVSGSSSLFTGINVGLTNAYAMMAQVYGASGINQTNIASAMTNPNIATRLNPTFASYMQSNFSTLDTNHDGTLSSAELTNLTNMISSTGLTQAQLAQLGPASGLSTNTLSQVLDHFADIDTNHDGRVTPAEISAYTLKSAEEKKKTEFANKAAANMSVFYGDEEGSSNIINSPSLLSFKYMNTDNSNGSNGNY